MARLLVFMFLVPMLAACTDGPAEDPCKMEAVLCDPDSYLQDHHCTKNDVRPRVYAPDTPGPDTQADPWVQGDWWEYALAIDGKQKDTRLVYYDDQDIVGGQAQHYMVGTPTREEALDHAIFSTNPVIGRVHRTLYSPHESGAHADMFAFPLCQGSTWQTRFFDTQFTMLASKATLQVPGGTDPLGFRIDGTAADGSTIALAYSPIVKWFTMIDLDRADGTRVDLQLRDFGKDATGPAFFLRGQEDVKFDLSKQGATTSVEREAGREGPYGTIGIHLAMQKTGDARVEVHVRDPSGAHVACVGRAGSNIGGTTECPPGPITIEAPWQEGTWSITIEKGLIGSASVTGEARLVSIYDRSGTV